MIWKLLASINDLDQAIENSDDKFVLLFKHSTSCSISHMAKMRLESKWNDALGIEPYYLDLLKFRNISTEIAERFSVNHESPQILLIKNNECIYDGSHMDISVEEIQEALSYHA